jgi:hypothetical protein
MQKLKQALQHTLTHLGQSNKLLRWLCMRQRSAHHYFLVLLTLSILRTLNFLLQAFLALNIYATLINRS